MMIRSTLVFFLLMVAIFVAPAFALESTDHPGRVLEDIRRSAAGVETLAAEFVQEKHLEMFQEVLESKGRFYYAKPDRLRWELTEPVPSGFVIEGEKGRRWHDRTGRAETFKVDRDPGMKLIAGQLFAWARVDLDWLQEQFAISVLKDSPVTLKLKPRAEGAEDYLDHLRIEFADDGRHVRIVEIFEKGGDFTRIVFLETQVNGVLDEALF